MVEFFIISGALGWIIIILAVAGFLLMRAKLDALMRIPLFYPYLRYGFERTLGGFLGWMEVLRLTPPNKITPSYIDALKNADLAQMKRMRLAYRDVDTLPTVIRGKKALGLSSIFQTIGQPMGHKPSPYTDPLQTPKYYIPGVPATPYFDPATLPWTPALEAAYPEIKAELTHLLERAGGQGFQNLVSQAAETVAGWNTFNFFFFSEKYEENCALCPRTTAVLESLPGLEKEQIMFSALNPQTSVPPHVGPMNGIIRAHLPLIVPEDCGIRVGNEIRTWEPGKVLAFDDSFIHEVWNRSDEIRIVLFINFWHPCFSEEEIEVLRRFRAAYEGSPVAQKYAKNMAKPRGHDLAGIVPKTHPTAENN